MRWLLALFDAVPVCWLVYRRLRRVENRHEVASLLRQALSDRRISPPEWSSLGKALGIFLPEE